MHGEHAMAMSEGRIVVLAALPMLVGAAWLIELRRPEPHAAATARGMIGAHASAERAVHDAEAGWLGVIVSGYSTDVGAEVSGSVSEVWVSVGARVKAGQQLLRIDPSAASEDVRAARAKLEQQRSAVARAEAELSEASDLVTRLRAVQSGVSDRQLLAASAREQQAQAALREARAGIGVHEADVGQQVSRSQKYVIRAPFDGIVVERFVDPGALVLPGQVVARVINGDYYVRFALPPDAARAQRIGQRVRVELGERVLAGALSDVQPEVDSASQLVFARAKLDASEEDAAAIIPGARVTVRPIAGEGG
jgi:RND family efflux transporter MFP subunit